MRRTALAVALLLATAPVARAEGPATDVKPDLRAVEVAAPSVREDVVVAPARVDARSTTAATVQERRMSTTTWVILGLAAVGAIAILAAVL